MINVKTILSRLVGWHLVRNHLDARGDGSLQSIIEGAVLRVVVLASSYLYKTESRFAHALDEVIKAVSQ